MEYQQWMQWLIPILCALLTGTGFWALLSARATAKATRDAAIAAAAPVQKQAETAEWSALMSYWQAEMSALRDTATKLDVRIHFLEQQREEDQVHIDALEQHIWKSLPPPPPPRRYRKTDPAP